MGLSILIQIAVFVVSTAYQMRQQKKMKAAAAANAAKQAEAADKRKGFQSTITGASSQLPVIYGKQPIGGIATEHRVANHLQAGTANEDRLFAHNLAASKSGSKNEFLHVQYAICHDGIEGVQWVKVDERDYNDSAAKYTHRIRTHNDGGTACGAATANNFANTNFFTDTAFATATYKLDRDEPNYGGPPQVGFLVKGRKVRAVTRSGTSPNYTYTLGTTFVYSNNPALCLLDYLLSSKFGRGLDVAEIELESFYNATIVCDTVVMTNANVGGQIHRNKRIITVADIASLPILEDRTYENEHYFATLEGNYWKWNKTAWVASNHDINKRDIPLYECNLIIDTEDSIRDNIQLMLSTMGLAELTWTTEGKYKLLVEYPTDAAEEAALISHHFNEDNIIRENIDISWVSANERVNQATVNFLNEHEDFKEDSIKWPPTGSALYYQYLTEDNEQPFRKNQQMQGITDPYHAQAAAEQFVRTSRKQHMVKFVTDKTGLTVEPGDFITITAPTANLTGDTYRVESMQVNENFTASIECVSFDFEDLAWNIGNDIAYSVPPVYDFVIEDVTNLTLALGSSSNNEFYLGQLSWDDLDNAPNYEYEVSFRPTGVGDYVVSGTTRNKTFDISFLDGMDTIEYWDFKVKAQSPLGSKSQGTTITNVYVNKAPDDIDTLTITEEQYVTNNAAGLKNRAIMVWSPASTGVTATYYDVEFKKTADTTFVQAGTVNVPDFTIPDLASGSYDFRVTPYSALNFAGNPFLLTKTIVGFSAVPADPTNFSGNINEGQINLNWDVPTDLDVLYGGYAQIRYHVDTAAAASWDTASILVEKLSGDTTNKTVPTMKGTFFLRFYDTLDQPSANASAFISTFEDASFNAVSIVDEDGNGFLGAKTNCGLSSGNLELSTGQSTMTYEFGSYFDLGEVVTARLVPEISASITLAGVLVSNYANVSLVDNFAGPTANAKIEIFVATTQTDPAVSGAVYTPFALLTIGSYTARGLKFKLIITAEDTNTAISVTDLNIVIDKKDIIRTGSSTSSASADTTITFTSPFYGGVGGTGAPSIGIQTIGGAAGDGLVIASRSKTDFSYSVYNALGIRVARTVDWQAIGQ
jgi:hypothetical protein